MYGSGVVIAILNHCQNTDLSFSLGQQDRAKLSLEVAHADIFRINLAPPSLGLDLDFYNLKDLKRQS